MQMCDSCHLVDKSDTLTVAFKTSTHTMKMSGKIHANKIKYFFHKMSLNNKLKNTAKSRERLEDMGRAYYFSINREFPRFLNKGL